MTIQRIEETYFPNTIEGKKFADEYQQKLKEQGIFWHMECDTRTIMLTSRYAFEVGDTDGNS